MLINETYHSTAQNMLYKFLGFGDYSSVDLIDGSSTWQVDLNHPIERTMPSYSVITNFGTAEHVFNIAQVFSTIHDLLKPNGIALHVLPAMGDADRGFWNIHPTVYFDIAMDNGYAIEDFVYVDAMNTRCLARERSRVLTEEDFRRFPISRSTLLAPGLNHAIGRQYIRNLLSVQDMSQAELPYGMLPYDYCFVAMRKLPTAENKKFSYPTQKLYRQTTPDYSALFHPGTVAIFGAGEAGQAIALHLKKSGRTVSCFFDNDPGRWGATVQGVPVLAPGTFKAGIFVVVASYTHSEDISRQLERAYMIKGKDFICWTLQ